MLLSRCSNKSFLACARKAKPSPILYLSLRALWPCTRKSPFSKNSTLGSVSENLPIVFISVVSVTTEVPHRVTKFLFSNKINRGNRTD